MICNFTSEAEYKIENKSNWIKYTNSQLDRGYIHERVIIDFEKKKIDVIKKELSKEKISLLDAGCGSAWLINEIDDINYTGLDFNDLLIKKLALKYKNSNKINFVNADIEESLPKELSGKKFDIIVCNFLFLELTNLGAAFKNLRDLLSENGCILITGLNPIFELFRDSIDNYSVLKEEIKSLRSNNNFGPVLKKPFLTENGDEKIYYYRIIYSLNDLIQAARKQKLLLLELVDQFNNFNRDLFAPLYNFIMFSKE